MKAKELKALLEQVNDESDIAIVSVNNDVLTVDDVAPFIVPSNVDRDCYYIYTVDANRLCEEG